MTTTIRDVSGDRRLTLEADNPLNPTSVFVTGPKGLVMEFDRATILAAAARELGLVDPLEVMVNLPEPAPFVPPEACRGCVFVPMLMEKLAKP